MSLDGYYTGTGGNPGPGRGPVPAAGVGTAAIAAIFVVAFWDMVTKPSR